MNALTREEMAIMLYLIKQLYFTHFTHSRMFVFKGNKLNAGGRKTNNVPKTKWGIIL